MSRPSVYLDYRTSDYELSRLEALGYIVVASERVSTLYSAVDGHPDLQLLRYNDTLLVHGGAGSSKLEELKRINPDIIMGKTELVPPYPRHVGLNALITQDLFIHKLTATDPVIKEFLKVDAERVILHTNQGYTRCSCAQVGKNTYATEDASMAKLLESAGKTVFFAEHSNIYLKGYDYGFIGGALSLLSAQNRPLLIISGELSKYRYGHELKEFLIKENIEYECIGNGLLMDRGSIIEIQKNLGNPSYK